MTYLLLFIILALYICGAFLMRAFLKIADCDDRDELKPILLWPYYIISPIIEIIRESPKNFKW